MNLRKQQLAELVLEGIDFISVKEDDLIIIRLPDGLKQETVQIIGQSIVDALRSNNKQNAVIVLPRDFNIQTMNEKDMKDLGWIKDVETTERNSNNSRLPEFISGPKVAIPLDEQRRIWEREVTELLRKLQDTNPNPSGTNTRN